MTSSSSVATFSGLGSGLPVQQLIEATITQNSYRLKKYQTEQTTATKQQSAYKTIQTKYNSFQSCLQTVIDSKLMYSFDLFDRKTVDVSDKSIASVSTGRGAVSGSIEMKVNSLAKPPKVTISDFGGAIKSNINLRELGVIDEAFSFAFKTPTGGVNISADIDAEDTLDTYIAKINKKIADNDKLDGSVTCSVDANGVTTLDFSGVTGGTLNEKDPFANSKSNFADVFGLAVDATNTKLVSVPKSSLNLDGKLSDNSAGIKSFGTQTLPETINIGGLDIEVTADTTLRQIMNKVNETADCQVTMQYDQRTNALNFKAKDDFYSDYIYFSGKTLLSDLGLTDSEGVVNTSVQSVRQPGEIEIEGKKIAIKSNKVTAADTGLTGVTITLNSVTPADEPLKIGISANTEDLTKAISNVVDSYNAIVKTVSGYTFVNTDTTDTETEDGALASDYSVESMQTSLQMMMMSPLNDSGLTNKALALVGVTTDNGQLVFDKSKFLNAFNENPEDVKKLLIGNKEKTITGVFEKVQKQVKDYLDLDTGFFNTKADSLSSSIKNLNKSILDEQSRLEQQRQALVKQYSNLDSIMSKYTSQQSSISALASS